ncbi:MAG: YdcF family protein [Minwuia sp.]|uniref:YdcF family protein n=1 Tax=Minwuia sp. TaxID=2493630 RepID=UPI003A8A9452
MESVLRLLSDLVGVLIRIDTFIVLLQLSLVVALLRDWHRMTRALAIMSLATLLALSFVPVGEFLLRPLERAYPPAPHLDRLDGIIVLGGGEDIDASSYWNQPQLNAGGERILAALALAREFPRAQILLTGGGQGADTDGRARLTESDVSARILLANGIEAGRILQDRQAHNTSENARFSKHVGGPGSEEVWVLVTSAFHMSRAMQSFEAAGWSGLIPFPVDFRSRALADAIRWDPAGHIQTLNTAVKAWVGLAAYRLLGR